MYVKGVNMKKIDIKNSLGLDVYINGKPNFDDIPEDLKNAFTNSLTDQVLEEIRKEREKHETKK